MNIRYFGWFLLLLCLCLLSCVSVEDAPDGILIIPGTAVSGAATVSETLPESTEDTVTTPATDAAAASDALAALPEMDDALAAQVSELLLDEVFLSQLECYGAKRDGAAAYLAAFLSYQQLRAAEGTAAVSAQTQPVSEEAVYWTAGGSVWHTTENCSALAKAKDIRSGTEAQALDMGKSRVCKRCGGS